MNAGWPPPSERATPLPTGPSTESPFGSLLGARPPRRRLSGLPLLAFTVLTTLALLILAGAIGGQFDRASTREMTNGAGASAEPADAGSTGGIPTVVVSFGTIVAPAPVVGTVPRTEQSPDLPSSSAGPPSTGTSPTGASPPVTESAVPPTITTPGPDNSTASPDVPTSTETGSSTTTVPEIPATSVPCQEATLDDLTFPVDSAVPDVAALGTLEPLVAVHVSTEAVISIDGYTDSQETDYVGGNLALSEDRAASIADHLVARGIDRTRLRVDWHGAEGAIDERETEEAYRVNRRVEVRFGCG